MKNKYIIKLYHYYLKKKYDNDKIVGIKESEKVLEKLKNLSVIEPISINDLDYMGKAFLNDLSSEYPKDSLKIFKMVKMVQQIYFTNIIVKDMLVKYVYIFFYPRIILYIPTVIY